MRATINPFVLAVCCLFSAVNIAAEISRMPQDNWPQWRGPLATGVAPGGEPPVEWSETKNVRWKMALPGKGHSTPIVWADQIFLTTAIPFGNEVKPRLPSRPGAHDNFASTHQHEYVVLTVSRATGKILWQKSLHKDLPHEPGHMTASLASNSPATDGEHVFASFGSRGIYCLDTSGKLLWKKDLGEMHTKHGHGEGISPVLHGETLVVNWDHEEKSFVVALDKRTGEQRWRKARAEDTSWATPIVVEHQGKAQVIVPGTNRVRGYDLATGDVIWECGGLSSNIVASPVATGGFVYTGSSYDTRNLLAIRLDGAKGDITGTDQVVWSTRRGCPYVPSPLLYGDSLYTLQHYHGIVSRLDVKTGESQGGPFRLDTIDSVYASPVGAAGRVYITSLDGVTQVMSHGDDPPKPLATNQLNDRISASAAIVGKEMFLRGEKYLYCLAEE